MGMTIAIDKLIMNKMPSSCKECPLTYFDTGDDAYFGANERRCVIDDSCIDGMVSERAYDCPLIEAIPKSDYENRLKADMAAMLTDIKKEIEEKSIIDYDEALYDGGECVISISEINNIIQEKIDKLKEK